MKTLQQMIAEQPLDVQEAIKEKTAELMLEAGLTNIREELNLSQQKLAEAIGVSQPAIAQIEQRGNDVRLSTLKRYIEAMGGKLRLTVDLPTGDSRIFNI